MTHVRTPHCLCRRAGIVEEKGTERVAGRRILRVPPERRLAVGLGCPCLRAGPPGFRSFEADCKSALRRFPTLLRPGAPHQLPHSRACSSSGFVLHLAPMNDLNAPKLSKWPFFASFEADGKSALRRFPTLLRPGAPRQLPHSRACSSSGFVLHLAPMNDLNAPKLSKWP